MQDISVSLLCLVTWHDGSGLKDVFSVKLTVPLFPLHFFYVEPSVLHVHGCA